MPDSVLNYGGSAFPVQGLGPGRRIALWVTGCTRGCPGCMTPELWPQGNPTALERIAAELEPWLEQADGLTISGGEPFDQPAALAKLIGLLRKRAPELEVLVYTGYTLAELKQHGPDCARLLGCIDVLIDGPYMQELPDTLLWRGSDNQRLHLLSARAQRHAWAVEAQWDSVRPLQLRTLGGAAWLLAGIPRRGDLESLRAQLRERGFGVIPNPWESET